jgi:MerR family transcriptional regulator, light-induced transcriptional regulator
LSVKPFKRLSCLIAVDKVFILLKNSPNMAKYSIKDLENFTGIKAHTIRIWEKRYSYVVPERTGTNIRFYSDADLRKLLNVSILNRNGIKISKIIKLSDKVISELVLELSQSKGDIEIQIEALVIAMIDLDESKFEKIFNTAVINYGFEETILKLIYPFFSRVGILWQIGSINPAQEHFISNLIRQKLIVAVDGISTSMNGNSKVFLLFLPEGEHHELGLIFYQYLIKKYKQIVYYLGETVPFYGLVEISKAKKFDFLVTSLNTSGSIEEIQKYIHTLSENFLKSTIYITGLFTSKINFSLPPNIILVEDVFKLKTELEKLTK